MTENWTRETALQETFALAQHLCHDRSTALEVTRRAWAALDVAVTAQSKRRYYRPRRQPLRSKVYLGKVHLLQRLVCTEAEALVTPRSQAGFTRIFLAAVVRRALERNSFHTALAVTRVLHDYTTREGMLLYTGLVREARRARTEDYWRSRKRWLMSELLQSFGRRMALSEGEHGEERFAVVEDSAALLPLVHETLAVLTPWGTTCIVPQSHESFADGIAQLAWAVDAAEDYREIQRMHALVHPLCFGHLTNAAGLGAPEVRLAIPRFHSTRDDSDEDAAPRAPRPLDDHEREALLTSLDDLSHRRRKAPNASLSVLVDGVERSRIVPEREATCRIVLGPDAARVDVVASEDPAGDPLPLAWLPLERQTTTDELRPMRRTLTLEGGQRLSFVVTNLPADDPSILPVGEVFVRYQETAPARCLALGLRRWQSQAQPRRRWSFAGPAVATLATLGLALAVFGNLPQQVPVPEASALVPPVASTPSPAQPSELLPVERARRATVDEPTRSFPVPAVGVRLADVRVLWLSLEDDAQRQSALVQRIEERLAKSGLALCALPEQADGALEIELLPTAGLADTDDPLVHWTLRLVNADGAVLWPASGSPRAYRGSLSRTTSRMTQDLAEVLTAARPRRTPRSDHR